MLATAIAAPPAGADWLKVTVQVEAVPEVKLEGLQDSDESVIADVRLMVAVCETPLRVAVSIAF